MESPLASLKARDPELHASYLAYHNCMQGIRKLYQHEVNANPATELTQVLHRACDAEFKDL